MNIFSLRNLFDGHFDRNALSLAHLFGSLKRPSDGFFRRFTGKTKTFKKNKRRGM